MVRFYWHVMTRIVRSFKVSAKLVSQKLLTAEIGYIYLSMKLLFGFSLSPDISETYYEHVIQSGWVELLFYQNIGS